MKKNDLLMAAVITTDKCTAACKECCFQCSPQKNNILKLEEIISFIDAIKCKFETVETIVFTGGEALLLKDTLFKSIKYANKLGFTTRVVSNGYWAKNPNKAKSIARILKKSSLTEINFSTGDNHQEWVPLESVVNACIATINEEIRTVVSIETFDEANFKVKDFYENQKIKKLLEKEDINNWFDIISSVWIPVHHGVELHYNQFHTDRDIVSGCDSLLEYIGINPQGNLVSCCGLTLNRIDEMNLGKFDPETIKSVFETQFSDLLKIWIWTDGPEYIYRELKKIDDRLYMPSNTVHMCQYCAYIYNNPLVEEALEAYLTDEILNSILDRYHLKLKNTQQTRKDAVNS